MHAMLVTNHKGGVGKTFVSVHLAKALSERGNRVLLVDCDGQYDAFRFFFRHKTVDNPFNTDVDQFLSLIGNKACKSLRSLGYEEENYDYIVIDGDARMADTVQNILQNEIKLVIAPVNFMALAIENLDDLFDTMSKLRMLDSPFDDAARSEAARKRKLARSAASQLIIVPLAADERRLDEFLKRHRVKTKVKVHHNMPRMDKEVKESLTDGVLIWDIEALGAEKSHAVKKYFMQLADKVRDFFD